MTKQGPTEYNAYLYLKYLLGQEQPRTKLWTWIEAEQHQKALLELLLREKASGTRLGQTLSVESLKKFYQELTSKQCWDRPPAAPPS